MEDGPKVTVPAPVVVCSDIKIKEPKLTENAPLSAMVVALEIIAMIKFPLI